MDRLAWVSLGSALGGAGRYLLSLAALRVLGPFFPYGTLVVNALGSFGIGLLMPLALDTTLISAEARIFLATGLFGGLTTYSTFNYETLALVTGGEWWLAAANVVATLVGCLAAGALGHGVGRILANGLVGA